MSGPQDETRADFLWLRKQMLAAAAHPRTLCRYPYQSRQEVIGAFFRFTPLPSANEPLWRQLGSLFNQCVGLLLVAAIALAVFSVAYTRWLYGGQFIDTEGFLALLLFGELFVFVAAPWVAAFYLLQLLRLLKRASGAKQGRLEESVG